MCDRLRSKLAFPNGDSKVLNKSQGGAARARTHTRTLAPVTVISNRESFHPIRVSCSCGDLSLSLSLSRQEAATNLLLKLSVESCSLAGKNNMRFLLALMSAVALACSPLLWGLTKAKPEQSAERIATVTETMSKNEMERAPRPTAPMLRKNTNSSVPLPPLKSLLRPEQEGFGDVQFLFNFAIAGFAKCGTSSLLNWLRESPEVMTPALEYENMQNDPASAILAQYNLVSKEGRGVTGYKSPHHIQFQQCLDFYRNHAPETKLIVTIRHPVTWFESFFNYRLLRGKTHALKGPPNELIGDLNASPGQPNSATGAFHRYLSRLGKTDLVTEELQLLNGFMGEKELHTKPPVVPNPVLLIENRQLSDHNMTRLAVLRQDIQQYLGLERELSTTPPRANTIEAAQSSSQGQQRTRIDICDDQYLPIRSEMMRVARNASTWIRYYFLESPDVVVSSEDFFDELLLSWMDDPCQTK